MQPEPLPWSLWAGEGERQDIRWRIEISRARLRYDQRHQVVTRVRLPLRSLLRDTPRRDLHLLIKVAGEDGAWLPGYVYSAAEVETRPAGRNLEFTVPVLLRPGRYRFGIFLHDAVTGGRSVAMRQVNVAPPRRDPLPGLGRKLPLVEFPEGTTASLALRPPGDGALRLPVDSPRPLRIEIVANISASTQYTRFPAAHRANLVNVLQVVSVLAQLQPREGTVGLTVLDVLNLQQIFSESDVRRLDWEEMLAAARSVNPVVVDVRSLERRREVASYFQEQMSLLLSEHGPRSPAALGGAAEKPRPLRVLILVGNPMLLVPGTRVPQLNSGQECDCRVYLLLPKVGRNNLWDDLGGVFRPLQPRRFMLDEPAHFRRALAEIVRELSSGP